MFRFYQHKLWHKWCWSKKISLEISFPSGDSGLFKVSFRFISSLFLIPLAQSQQISSFDFLETKYMFDCFRRIAASSAGLGNDVIRFLAQNANENLASETSPYYSRLHHSLIHFMYEKSCFAHQNIFSRDSCEVDLWQIC